MWAAAECGAGFRGSKTNLKKEREKKGDERGVWVLVGLLVC